MPQHEHIRQAEHEIRQAAERIDPYTARMASWYAQSFDPYNLGYDLSPDYDQVGREDFLQDPEGKWVLAYEVRELHPEISDEEWWQLMRDAAQRDDR
jgi:hypothetical protein